MQKSRIYLAVCVFMPFSAVAPFASAQTSPACTVQVLVTDPTGARIPDAIVLKTTPTFAVATDRNGEGQVWLCDSPILSAQAQGFRTTSVTLGANPQPKVSISLPIAFVSGPVIVTEPEQRLKAEPVQITAVVAPLGISPPPTRAALRTPAQAAVIPPSGTTLALIGPTIQSVLTGDKLAAMPHQTVTVENAHTHASETYSGVLLVSVLESVGAPTGKDVHGKALSEYVVATGSDGYKAVIALAEAEPDFHPGQVLVADQLAGKPLDVKEGPFKLIVSEDKHPARSVHNLVKLELKSAE